MKAKHWAFSDISLFIGSVESTISFTVQSVTCVYQLRSRIRTKLVRNQLVCSAEYWPFNGKCSYHIETSQLICSVNQLAGFYMMETLHGMHVKNFRKKSVVEGQKLLILEGGSVIGGSMFPVTLREFCGEMKKIHNHSVKDYCSTLQRGQYALTKKNIFRTVRRHWSEGAIFVWRDQYPIAWHALVVNWFSVICILFNSCAIDSLIIIETTQFHWENQ